MDFSPATFQAAVDKIDRGIGDISAKMGEIPDAANNTLGKWYIPGPVKDAIKWLAEKMLDLAEKILAKIQEVVRGIAAPVYFFNYAMDLNDASAQAEGIVASLADQLLIKEDEWGGEGATAYRAEVPPQRDAVSELGSIAEQMKSSLLWAAVAGSIFYVGLGVIIVKFVAAMVAAIAALGSAVFSWAGAGIVAEEAGVNLTAIGALVTTLIAMLGDQVKEMGSLQNAASSSKFPGPPVGRWPRASA